MTDIFRDRKLVHVKLDKDTHAMLRSALFKAGLSMQEILSEFCRQYINESPLAVRLIENYVVRKNAYKLKALEQEIKLAKKPQYELMDADRNAIYDMIDEGISTDDPEDEDGIDD